MIPISLDQAHFPELDIVALANSGQILRAERGTPSGSLPAFVTSRDWSLLLDRFGNGRPENGPDVLTGLEKAAQRLLGHLADAAGRTEQTPATSFCPSDLFEDEGTVLVALVRDATHPVACALIGTDENVRAMLREAS